MKRLACLLALMAACGGDDAVLVKQQIGITVLGRAFGTGADNIWVDTSVVDASNLHRLSLAHSSDGGASWIDVALPMPALSFAAASDGAAWVAGNDQTTGLPALLRVRDDGTVDDFTADLPPQTIGITSLAAGGGGVFVSSVTSEMGVTVGHIHRFDGAGLVELTLPAGTTDTIVLDVLGPDEAVVALPSFGGLTLQHYAGGAFAPLPWSGTAAPHVRHHPDGAIWGWDITPSLVIQGVTGAGGSFTAFQTPIELTDIPAELVPLGGDRAALIVLRRASTGGGELLALHIDASGQILEERHLADCVLGECQFGSLDGLVLDDGAVRLLDGLGYWWVGARDAL